VSVVTHDQSGAKRSLQGNTLVDILDRILDKGLVVAGDIVIQLADVELLTIKIRLLVCSVDKAVEIGMDWWKHDDFLSHSKKPQLSKGRKRVSTIPVDTIAKQRKRKNVSKRLP
jgi:hypothetical protein